VARHFLFEDKEYRIRATFKRRKAIRDPVAELARLLRKGSKGAFGGTRQPRADLRQKCVAKMQYSNSLEAHKVQLEKYLIREGAGMGATTPQLFGTDIEEYKENMVDKNFRIFLSPQKNVNLNELAERFITKLEKQTGYRLYWQGACHYNTAHPHVHLLINGVDQFGREIKFPRDIVKTFMRETARDLCTSQLGERTRKDLDLEQEQELSVSRFTRLDERIQKLSGEMLRIRSGMIGLDKERVLARLETLRKLKLCTYENGGYTLKKNWQEDLKANGRYNTFLKAREELQYTAPSLMTMYSGKQGLITGKVTHIYRPDDDAGNNHVVVLEGIDGKAYFIPLLKRPELYDGKVKSSLKEGELITVKTNQTQKGRLTPVFFKRTIKAMQKEIKNNNYSGTLAEALSKTKVGILDERRINQS
jgi:hypothetical protein